MDLVYVDTETTSLIDPHRPDGRRVWEIAVLTLPADRTPALCAVLQITDVDITDADPESLAIGKFAERFVPDGYGILGEYELPGRARPVTRWGCDEAMALTTLRDLIRPGAIIAGSNPSFDQANMAEMFRRHGQEPPAWFYHPRDVPNHATGWLRGRLAAGAALTGPAGICDWSDPSYSTRVLSEACGIPQPADRHSAWADALWMAQLDAVVRGRPLVATPVVDLAVADA